VRESLSLKVAIRVTVNIYPAMVAGLFGGDSAAHGKVICVAGAAAAFAIASLATEKSFVFKVAKRIPDSAHTAFRRGDVTGLLMLLSNAPLVRLRESTL
jgi:hypothetical protein